MKKNIIISILFPKFYIKILFLLKTKRKKHAKYKLKLWKYTNWIFFKKNVGL